MPEDKLIDDEEACIRNSSPDGTLDTDIDATADQNMRNIIKAQTRKLKEGKRAAALRANLLRRKRKNQQSPL